MSLLKKIIILDIFSWTKSGMLSLKQRRSQGGVFVALEVEFNLCFLNFTRRSIIKPKLRIFCIRFKPLWPIMIKWLFTSIHWAGNAVRRPVKAPLNKVFKSDFNERQKGARKAQEWSWRKVVDRNSIAFGIGKWQRR